MDANTITVLAVGAQYAAALGELLAAVDGMEHTSPGEDCPTCDFEREHGELLDRVRELLRKPPC